ncbi:sugar phosphate nucleotidyltransferase [Bacillus sp. UNC41MFS5]|uniref:sugar phosphate nucleotidyltransferase n=1 Tax=Bacillus sp. UNC41MFS5 TaxID=1449046 RepID=UPI0009E05581|nr:sugar phosphate nucleotidyltransferase [Bacillus sp. UNC41MFS5]
MLYKFSYYIKNGLLIEVIYLKGILLCAGRGSRMLPFTLTTPKTLLPVVNRPMLDHSIEKLRDAGVNEIGVVINPSQTQIIEHLDAMYPRQNIKVFEQTEPLGVAHAIRSIQKFVEQEPFVLLLADNLFVEPLDNLIRLSEEGNTTVLLGEVSNPQDFGIALIEKGKIVNLEEKPANPKSNLAIMGAYVFQPSIFEAIYKIPPSTRGEYEITDAIQWLIDQKQTVCYEKTKLPIFDVGTLDRWLEANSFLLAETDSRMLKVGTNTRIEGCKIIGNVIIGDGCDLTDAVIGPNVAIEDGCIVRNCSIENSILLKNTLVDTPCSIINSILGRESILQGGNIAQKIVRCILEDYSMYKFN